MEKVKQRFEYNLDEINQQYFNDAIKLMLKAANEHGLNGDKIEFIKTGISDRYNTYFIEFEIIVKASNIDDEIKIKIN